MDKCDVELCCVSIILPGFKGNKPVSVLLLSTPSCCVVPKDVSHRVCVCIAGAFNKLKWLLAWPLCLLLYFTVPNCSTPRWENWFMLSFVSSTLWIASFSYIMVWMVSDRQLNVIIVIIIM